MNKTGDIYAILDLVSGKVTDTHVHQLQPFNYDPERTHTGYRRSTMKFLVKWEDFGDTESW